MFRGGKGRREVQTQLRPLNPIFFKRCMLQLFPQSLRLALPGFTALLLVWGWFYWWTLGFTAFTSYSYVVEAAGPPPRPAPHLKLQDSQGRIWFLHQPPGHYTLVTFGYLDCSGTCPVTLAEYHSLHEELQGKAELQLVTLTLDLERDRPSLLQRVWQSYGSPQAWSLASPLETTAQAYFAQLIRMGMWVDWDAAGNPIHDNRSFLINPQGTITHSFAGTPTLAQLRQALPEAW